MRDFFLFLFNATLINNLVISYLVGVELQVTMSRRVDVAWFTGLSTLYCLCVVLPCVYLMRVFIVIPLEVEYLDLLLYALLTLVIVLSSTGLFRRFSPLHFKHTPVVVPVLLISSILFPAILLQESQINSFMDSFLFGLMSGLGFLFLLLVITLLRERIDNSSVPKPLQELPIILITFGMLSMGLAGLS